MKEVLQFPKYFIHIYEIFNGGQLKIFCEKAVKVHDRCFSNSFFPFLKNSYSPVSDMTCFTDIST